MTFGAVLLDSGPAQRPGGVAKVLPEGNIDTSFEAGRSSATPSNLHANSPRLRASQMGHDLSAAGPLEEGPRKCPAAGLLVPGVGPVWSDSAHRPQDLQSRFPW